MTRLNQASVSDITYIKTAIVIDLCDRQIIGWALLTTMYTNETILPAWKMAVSKRSIKKPLIFHSDRGIQHTCKAFINF